MKSYLSLTALFFLLVFCLSGCGRSGYAGPEKAVRDEFDLICQLDEDTISSFFSADETSQNDTEDAIEATKLFFQNFHYDILSSSLKKDGTIANVTVAITNIDARALAKDLCLELIRSNNSTLADPDAPAVLPSYFTVMKSCLTEHEYPDTKKKLTVQVNQTDTQWEVENTPELADALAGGLGTYINDPDLLDPKEILEVTLSPFLTFTEQDWIRYLEISNLFSVDAASSEKIDESFARQLAQHFQYEIKSSKKNGSSVMVKLMIHSLDLHSVMEHCKEELLTYASSSESLRATEEELSRKISDILFQALENNTAETSREIEIAMTRSDQIWEANLDENFSNALLGNLEEAMEILTLPMHTAS